MGFWGSAYDFVEFHILSSSAGIKKGFRGVRTTTGSFCVSNQPPTNSKKQLEGSRADADLGAKLGVLGLINSSNNNS